MNTQTGKDEYLTVTEAATEAGLTEMAVRAAVKRGRLAAIEKYGRLLIAPSDFQIWRSTAKRGRPKKKAEA